MEIIYSNKPAEDAGKKLNLLLKNNSDRDVLLLVSAGSTFSLFSFVETELLGPNITIGMLDERYSDDPEVNNFLQFERLPFCDQARQADVNLIRTDIIEEESSYELANRFENILQDWKRENPEGVVIATFGVGEDGHTAGIFPFAEEEKLFIDLFEDLGKWVISYDVGGKNKYHLRVTTTLSFMRANIQHAIFYISGEPKRPALLNIRSSSGKLCLTPARIAHELPDTTIFTDIDSNI